ncbi:MAG: Gfo/Idh/MocA family oxidoreductase [Actinomycetota bacterium]|nr:Gfo/Idh/MocA family oxidoreductase [Actinomycetota bacterium]
MRILVIGAGRMGDIRATDLSADPRVDEVLVTNRTPQRAIDLAEKVRGRAIDWEQAALTEADAYVMALATDAHSDLLDTLIDQRKPILCEKPIALSIADTERICEKVEETGTPMQIGFQRRFDVGIARVHQAIGSGAVGTLYDVVLASRDHTPPSREFLPGSGGIFRDLHVHDLDLVAWLTDSPIATVQATRAVRGEGDYAEFDDADITRIIAVTESGILASIAGARHNARGHDVRLEVFGSKDSLSAGITSRTPLLTVDGPDVGVDQDPYSGFIDRFREAFRAETIAFVDLVCGGANPCPPQAALDAMRAAVACEASVRTGRTVNVEDIRDD